MLGITLLSLLFWTIYKVCTLIISEIILLNQLRVFEEHILLWCLIILLHEFYECQKKVEKNDRSVATFLNIILHALITV